MESNIKYNIVSWDFDGTLADHFDGTKNDYKKITTDLVKKLRRRGYEIHIITRRFGPDNYLLGKGNEHVIVYEKAKELGVLPENVHFTAREWKFKKIKEIGASIHLDDDITDLFWIIKHIPSVKGVQVGSENWEQKFIKILDTHDKLKIWLSNEDNIVKLCTSLVVFLLITITFFKI